MKQVIPDRFPLILLGVMFISFILVNFVRPSQPRNRIIDGDGSGLYAYLPAVLIYRTVDFQSVFEFEKSRRSTDYQGHYFHEIDEVLINKFSCGTALLQLPFFLLAWLFSILIGLEPDGYNMLFQYGVAISAFLWVVAGLLYFVKLAELYSVKKQTAAILALTVLFGTNLFYYTFFAPAASHAYSFAMITIFLYYTKLTFLTYSRKSVYLAALTLGILVLIRPVNIVAVASIPFLASSPKAFIETIRIKLCKKDYLFAPLIFIAALLPQIIINLIQVGQPFVFGYKHEGFYFNNPEFINFLLSYRKGWFIYTPFMLLIIPGIVYLWKRSVYEFITFLVFFLLLVYVFSSWWNWLYGDSFGMRPMVDFYGLFLLIIALLIHSLNQKSSKTIIWSFAGLAILLNLIQTFQYATGIIHPDSMNKAAYWHVFMKTSGEYIGDVADTDEYFYGNLNPAPLFVSYNDLENEYEGWSRGPLQTDYSNSGISGIRLDESKHFSASYTIHIPAVLEKKNNLYVNFESQYMEPEQNAAMGGLFVVHIEDFAGQTAFYKTFRMKQLPDKITNEWKWAGIGFKLPVLTEKMATVKLYIWNRDKQIFYLDDLLIAVYTYQN